MAKHLRFLPSGNDGLLVDLADLPTTLAALDQVLSAKPEGVMEVVPAAQTLLLRFDPAVTDRRRLIEQIAGLDLSPRHKPEGKLFDIPVEYSGEDLADVADILGCSVEEVIRRHTDAVYTVAFTGFAPGFAYMVCEGASLHVPRRRSPRVRIPAGSVAIAGKFSGIYPSDSPGGWQIIGVTPLLMWDSMRSPPALLAPGDRVQFRDMAKGATVPCPATASALQVSSKSAPTSGLCVTRSYMPAFFQDLGRSGFASQGVSGSGALDRLALRAANRCVGNPEGTAVLEITLGGFAIRADRAITVAVTGAPCPITIRTSDGRDLPADLARPIALDAGDELSLGMPTRGMRSYLALRGGFLVDPVLGSASTDTLARLGPLPVKEGDVLLPANSHAYAVYPGASNSSDLPSSADTVVLDVVLGPRTDWFTDKGLQTFLSQDWNVTAESSRVGARLSGASPIERQNESELPSEGAVRGAIQVPHSGQPVLFLADHPLTGGYPVIGVVAAHHLDLAAQIPIGARIRFNAVASFEPEAREARL